MPVKILKTILFSLLLCLFLTAEIFAADTSGMELFAETGSFRFYARDADDYSDFYQLLDEKSREFELLFQKKLPVKVDFYIYPDRVSFFRDALHCDKPFGTTTALADHVGHRIHLTSPYDEEVIKIGKDMKKVAVHELVHLYFPSRYIFIREGMAEYYSDRLNPMLPEDIPKRLSDMAFYHKGDDETRKAYNASGWMMKFIIEECLNGGLQGDRRRFLKYTNNPEDYTILGYGSEAAFFEAFSGYIKENIY